MFRLPIHSPFALIQKTHINRTGTPGEKQRDETRPPEWIVLIRNTTSNYPKREREKNDGKEMHIKFFPRYLNIKAHAPGDNTLDLFFFSILATTKNVITNLMTMLLTIERPFFINEFDL